MKMPGFLEGAAIALGTGIVGSVTYSALTLFFASSMVMRLLIAAIGLGYVVYLLSRSRERIGRITTITLWLLVAGIAWFTAPPLILFLMVHLGLIWLIRSLYFYSSLISAIADLGLNGVSLATAVWAANQTGSLFVSIWCFFLVQALFVAIPAKLIQKAGQNPTGEPREDRFQHAYRTAETALRKLSSIY
jgi:hypothetical protein